MGLTVSYCVWNILLNIKNIENIKFWVPSIKSAFLERINAFGPSSTSAKQENLSFKMWSMDTKSAQLPIRELI